ncbi:MAG: SDR family oxidoreductase [Clostridia bacterium]|nr:SDR family oxidoreductase [Clostridia bacterium]
MKRVIVTGGSRGIGAECVRHFTERGDRVVFLYNKSLNEAEALSFETGAFGIQCDVSDTGALKGALAEAEAALGGVDILVNNAGRAYIGLLGDMSDEEILSVYRTDLLAATVACREVSRGMIRAHNGYIVNIGSVWGRVGASCEAVYSAAKAGLRGLTMALAKELGPSGITVNCIEPGVILTDMNASLAPAALGELCDETPLCRLGETADIAEAVLFLTSGRADFITGQCLGVDGGFGL